MKINRQEFLGTGKVFRFTFYQMMKNKGNIASLVLMLLLALGSVPAAVLMNGTDSAGSAAPAAESGRDEGREQGEYSEITKVYMENQTQIVPDTDRIKELDSYYEKVLIEEAGFEPEDYQEYLNNTELFILMEQASPLSGYTITVKQLPDSLLDEGDVSAFAFALQEAFEEARYAFLGVEKTQMEQLSAAYQTQVLTAEDYIGTEDGDENNFETRYALQMVYAIFVMMISIMSVSFIIRAIVEEKASKLVELLMVSVRPLALIVGKILASMAFVFGLCVLMLLGFAVSYVATGFFFDVSGLFSALSDTGISLSLLHTDPLAIVSIVISLLCGYLTFALLAGLSGSACSSTSETESAIMMPTLVIMAGYMVSCMITGFDKGAVTLVCSLLPVVSVFCAPVQYLVGNIGFGILTLSWILQLAAALLLALFCAKVYQELIIYRGSRVKLKQMIAMAGGNTKQNRKGAKSR